MTTFITKQAYQLIPGDQVQLASHPDLQASATEERTHSPVEIAGRVIDGLISIRLVDMEPVLLGANDVLKLKVPAILEFPHRLLLTENDADERLDVGFAFRDSIVRDNLVSEGNTFSHPLDIYGLTPENHKALVDFNKAIDDAVEDAIPDRFGFMVLVDGRKHLRVNPVLSAAAACSDTPQKPPHGGFFFA